MLSHPANHEPELAEVAAADSEMHEASGSHRRHLSVADVFGHFDREFFRSWFIDGPWRLLTGRFSAREGVFMAISAMPALLAFALIMLPAYLFHTPEHSAFYHFGQCLRTENASLIPMALGTISSLFGLRFPHGS